MIIEEYLKANHPSLYKEEKTIDTDRIIKNIISTNTYAKLNLIRFILNAEQEIIPVPEMLSLVGDIVRQFSSIQHLLERSGLIKEMSDRGLSNPVGKLLLELPEDFIDEALRSPEFEEYEFDYHKIVYIKQSIENIYRNFCVSLYTRSRIDKDLIINIMESEYIILKYKSKALWESLHKESK